MSIILITGAHGFIGKHLSSYLSNAGYNVFGLGHGSWSKVDALNWGVKNWMRGDVQIDNLRKICSQEKPEIIFHLAGGATVSDGQKNPDQDFFKNVTSTSELLEWIRRDTPISKLVVASSASVYGQGFDGPVSENSICEPYSTYGKNKKKMELMCQFYKKKYNLNIKIARLFSVYGAELKKQLLWDICIRLKKMETPLILGGTGNESRDWIYIDDLVNILASIGLNNLKMKNEFIVNIGTGIGKTIKEIAEIVLFNWNKQMNLSTKCKIEFSGISRPGDPFSLVADTSRLSKLGLSYKMTPKMGINLYVNWFQKLKKF